jgi:HAD superfamily hydrolase (TIGR01509 family)
MLKALLFDLDGTLSNTDAVHFSTWIEVLRHHDIEVDREYYEEYLSGRNSSEAVDEILPGIASEDRRKLLTEEEERSRSRAEEVGALPGLAKLLQEARRRGLGVALVTNSIKQDATRILRPLGLEDAFDPVVFPEEVSDSKPSPLPYREALDRIGIEPEEALAFEDSLTGTKAAVEVGIPTVGIAREEDPANLREAGVTLVIGDFADQALYELLDERS